MLLILIGDTCLSVQKIQTESETSFSWLSPRHAGPSWAARGAATVPMSCQTCAMKTQGETPILSTARHRAFCAQYYTLEPLLLIAKSVCGGRAK